MTTAEATRPRSAEIDPALLTDVREHAGALDRGELPARRTFPALGEAGRLDLGSPHSADGGLLRMVEVIASLAGECVSTAFSVWAHRMTIEYLAVADTEAARTWLPELRAGRVPGITGMASAFKEVAGCGSVDLDATPVPGGYRISGTLRWASNLYEDALLVSAARSADGSTLVFATPLAAVGVTAGAPFSLLALGSTASSSVVLEDVFIADSQVMSTDLHTFLAMIRPTFLALQTALCLGLAGRCLAEARTGLVGINSTFAADLGAVSGRHALLQTTLRRLASAVGTDHPPTPRELLSMRLGAAEVATEAAGLEIRTAGGRGYARATPASRRFREATFLPVQSPSEGQLRWELAQCA